ncbi:hypothetical protein SAMN05444422_101215 [Halobiforma haloterrestris]|uniref:Uncharacterized protein n=1 Tax=Natronobacterium haloterrestre TaxID=148448 RepID=A0A1I1D2D5_NATHA|nr:hypothetical protein [Halobiforma haloterrestris]SFB69085.1 hypothetical protein SAMN05444422_101215 [Halobiforma haloterrestris]
MSDQNDNGLNRRSALASIAASTVTLPSLAAADAETKSDWDCNSDCPQEEIKVKELYLPDPTGSNKEREGSVAIHWKSSGYSTEQSAWIHVFSVSGGAASTSELVSGGYIYGQQYRLESSGGDIQPSTQSNRHGQYPCDDNDETIPGWGQPLVEAAIGTISVGASWFLAVNESLREKMGHRPDGFDIFADGFEYGDMATSLTSPRAWSECSFFHRAEFQTTSLSSSIDVTLGICTHDSAAATTWKNLEGSLEFFADDEPEYTPDSDPDPHPEDLPPELVRKYGIKEVSDKNVTINGRGEDGQEEYSIDYVATNSPLSTADFEVVTKEEKDMDDPNSERYRDNQGEDPPSDY